MSLGTTIPFQKTLFIQGLVLLLLRQRGDLKLRVTFEVVRNARLCNMHCFHLQSKNAVVSLL